MCDGRHSRADKYRGDLRPRARLSRRRAARSGGRRRARGKWHEDRACYRRARSILPSIIARGNVRHHRRAHGFSARDAIERDRAAWPNVGSRFHAGRRKSYRGDPGNRRHPVAPIHQRGDQRCDRQPRRRAAPVEWPQFSCACTVERRRRSSARWHAGRRAAAGRTTAQRGRAAFWSQYLPARRRQGDRRAVQQSRHQSVGRVDPGVQDPEVPIRRRVRRQGICAHQRRHASGFERVPRHPIRVPPARRVRRPQLLRSARPASPAAATESVRRRGRWSPGARPKLLLFQL